MVEKTVKRLGVLVNREKPEAADALKRLVALAAKLGLKLCTPDAVGPLRAAIRRVKPGDLVRSIDALLVLGGDGSMLRAVSLLNGSPKPVLGVNLGSLGFLTSTTLDRLEDAVEALAGRRYRLADRALLDCRCFRGRTRLGRYRALNDVVVGWGASSRMLHLDLALDGEGIATFACDGLIVSTPTGSTGHSLSAGGPIVHPETPALAINVICPHTLSNRPLVIPDRVRVAVSLHERSTQRVLLSVDGQPVLQLHGGDRYEIARCRRAVRFVVLPGHRYFGVLSQKLHWRGSVV